MKLSLKSINGKLRILAQRIGQGLKFVAECCCYANQNNLFVIGYNCCEGWGSIPRIAVRADIASQLERECQWEWALMVRVGGSESCFRLTPFQVVPREETAGLVIVENISQIECVPNNRSYPGIRCGTQTCPICPANCCFTHIYPKECPDFHRVPQENPKSNICCSWGRDYTIIISYQTRLLEEFYSLTGTPSSRSFTQRSGREVMRRLVCGENAEGTPDDIRCIEAQHYLRNDFESFLDPNLNTSGEDRTDRCITLAAYPVKQTPIIYGPGNTPIWPSVIIFPSRPGFRRILNENGTTFTSIVFGEGDSPLMDGPVCQDLDNFVSTEQTTADRDIWIETRYRTTFRYGLVCLQGSIFFDQVEEVVEMPSNILLSRRTFRHEAAFSVRVNSSTHCPPTVCDGYAQTGNVITLPGWPPPQPIQGALSLL
jgi:hypothetical protein